MDGIKIFFIDIDNFSKIVDKNFYQQFLDGNSFKSEKRIKEYCFGRFLIKFVLKKYYNIENPVIDVKNKKPYLVSNPESDFYVTFSLSHSKNYVMAAFYLCSNQDVQIGLDIEYIKPRNFEKLLNYYNVDTPVYDAKTFYKFWTQYEANIKLQDVQKSVCSFQILNDYILSLVTNTKILDIEKKIEIKELVFGKGFGSCNFIDLQQVLDFAISDEFLFAKSCEFFSII